jgi:hypothetical protein
MDDKISRTSKEVREDINTALINGMENSVQANIIKVTGVKTVNYITPTDKGQQATFEKRPIWFDMRDPVISFTGRDKELKERA